MENLLTRGVEKVIPKKLAEEKLKAGKPLRVYLGIDPTGTKLHLGHSVPLRKLQQFAFRRAGGRAYKWRRRSGSGAQLPWLWLSLRGRLPFPTDYVGAIERCAAAFDAPSP